MAQNTVTVAINADVLPFLKSQHEALAALAIAYESAADHILRRIQAIEGRAARGRWRMSEIEIGMDRGLLRDLLTNQCEADVLVDLIRAAGISHETDVITVVISDGE